MIILPLIFPLFFGISLVDTAVFPGNYKLISNCEYRILSKSTWISSEVVISLRHCSMLCDSTMACRAFQFNPNNKNCSLFWEKIDQCFEEEETEETFTYEVCNFHLPFTTDFIVLVSQVLYV